MPALAVRGELGPAAEIDLLILRPQEPDPTLQERLEKLIGHFWDIGLEIGHSVRTIQECLNEAASDITVQTALLEARLLTGNKKLFTTFDKRLRGNRGPVIAVMLLGLMLTLIGLTFAEQLAQFTQLHLGPALGRGTVGVTLVGLCGFFLFGPYSMVGGGVIALDYGGRTTAATAAGLLDSAGYLAATLAGFGVAQLVTSRGWSFTFLSMAGLTAVALVLCLLVWNRSRAGSESVG